MKVAGNSGIRNCDYCWNNGLVVRAAVDSSSHSAGTCVAITTAVDRRSTPRLRLMSANPLQLTPTREFLPASDPSLVSISPRSPANSRPRATAASSTGRSGPRIFLSAGFAKSVYESLMHSPPTATRTVKWRRGTTQLTGRQRARGKSRVRV